MPEFNDKAKPAPANMGIFYESLDSAAVVPAPPNGNMIMPIMDRYYRKIWAGEISVDEAVKAMHTEVQAEMDKLKK
jgi:hypothetical protein